MKQVFISRPEVEGRHQVRLKLGTRLFSYSYRNPISSYGLQARLNVFRLKAGQFQQHLL